MGAPVALGIDIGGTKIAAAFVDRGGSLLSPVYRSPTNAQLGGQHVLSNLTVLAVRALAERPLPVQSVGVATAGVVDRQGVIQSATGIIPGWGGVRVAQHLEKALSLPTTALNDVHAAAIGELHCGIGCDVDDFLFAAVGTGIGGARVLNGKLVLGRTATAGSIGHVTVSDLPSRLCSCGQLNHVEAYASGPAIENDYCEQAGSRLTLRQIASRAEAGDLLARRLIAEAGAALGAALATAANLVDPAAIVLGGGVVQMGSRFVNPALNAVRSLALPGPSRLRVVTSALGTDAPIIGAAIHSLTGESEGLDHRSRGHRGEE